MTNISTPPSQPAPPSHVPKERVSNIDMYNHIVGDEDYHESWVRIRNENSLDLVWTPHNGGHWVALRGSMIREIYADYQRFTSEVMYIPKAVGEKYDMIPVRMDPPEHTPFREILNKTLNLREVRKLEEPIRRLAASMIDEIKEKGECDICTDFASKFPIYVFLEMAGLPRADTERLADLATRMVKVSGSTPDEMVAGFEAARNDFFDYVRPAVAARKGKPGHDLLSDIVNSEVNGRAMTERETLSLVSLVLLAGLDTTVNFIGFMFAYLGRHPERVKELTSDPSRIPRCVEEMFRRFPLVAEARMVAKDQIYEGVELKKGEMVLLPTALSGLDERENECPMKLNFQRKTMSHTTFGEGAHRCAGMHLARLEIIVTLQEWLARIPEFELVPNARSTYVPGLVAGIVNVPLKWDLGQNGRKEAPR